MGQMGSPLEIAYCAARFKSRHRLDNPLKFADQQLSGWALAVAVTDLVVPQIAKLLSLASLAVAEVCVCRPALRHASIDMNSRRKEKLDYLQKQNQGIPGFIG